MARQFLALQSTSFGSLREFEEFRREHEGELATRWLHERTFSATKKELSFEGTCGVCLGPAVFEATTAGGEVVGAGRVPNWRETMACDCRSRLIGRERGVLQFLMGNIGIQPWCRILLLGASGALTEVLETVATRVVTQTAGGAEIGRRGPAAAQYHLVVALETLHIALSPVEMLRGVAQALLPGGRFVFTLPLHSGQAQSDSAEGGPGGEHRTGWDILQLAKDAGFKTTLGHFYWSEEFGYLGSSNLIFSAAG